VGHTTLISGEGPLATEELLRAELDRGYVLGNHTWDHADLVKLPAAKQAAEMDRMSTEQHDITRTWPCLFRPPYGAYNKATLHLARLPTIIRYFKHHHYRFVKL